MKKYIYLFSIAALFFVIAGSANGVMDTLNFHHSISVFADWSEWWGPTYESWILKYKNGDPAQGPAFFLSTTFLVFLTDAWHFSQFVMLWSWTIGALFFAWGVREYDRRLTIWFFIIAAILIRFFSGIGFYLFYNLILV